MGKKLFIMRSPAILLSSSLVNLFCYSFLLGKGKNNHYCTSRTKLSVSAIFLFISIVSFSQVDSVRLDMATVKVIKKNQTENKLITKIHPLSFNKGFSNDPAYYKLTHEQKKKRIWFVAASNVVGYSGAMVALSSAWYSQYKQTSFHTFNDFPECVAPLELDPF